MIPLLLTACGKADPTVENTNAPLETEMQGSTVAQSPADSAVLQNQGDSIAVIPPRESGDSASNNADSQTKPASSSFHCEPVTFDGYSLTPEGDSVPVRLTMAVENVLEGEAAWQQMISQGTQLPAPEQGKEYILVTVKVTYEDGDLETLNFVENYPASWAAARVHFNIPNENGNTEDVTYNLLNPIWGPDPFGGRSLTKGESVTGDVAFLQDIGKHSRSTLRDIIRLSHFRFINREWGRFYTLLCGGNHRKQGRLTR